MEQQASQVTPEQAVSQLPKDWGAYVLDAYHSSGSEEDFAAKVKDLPIPDTVKADLWDLKHETLNSHVREKAIERQVSAVKDIQKRNFSSAQERGVYSETPGKQPIDNPNPWYWKAFDTLGLGGGISNVDQYDSQGNKLKINAPRFTDAAVPGEGEYQAGKTATTILPKLYETLKNMPVVSPRIAGIIKRIVGEPIPGPELKMLTEGGGPLVTPPPTEVPPRQGLLTAGNPPAPAPGVPNNAIDADFEMKGSMLPAHPQQGMIDRTMQTPLQLNPGTAHGIPGGGTYPIPPDPSLPRIYSRIDVQSPPSGPGTMGVNPSLQGTEGPILPRGEQTVTPTRVNRIPTKDPGVGKFRPMTDAENQARVDKLVEMKSMAGKGETPGTRSSDEQIANAQKAAALRKKKP